VLVHGANFTPTTEVWFGSDADSGAGGAPAPMVELLDANTLRVVTPAFAGGRRNVVVLDSATSQAAVAASAFTFMSSGGGGGGCSMGPIVPAEPPFRGSSGWIALLFVFAWLVFRARRSKGVAA
jgi:hypothetical protein